MLLFFEVVHWYSLDNTSQMVYSDASKEFWKVFHRFFHGKAFKVYGGHKVHRTDSQRRDLPVSSVLIKRRYSSLFLSKQVSKAWQVRGYYHYFLLFKQSVKIGRNVPMVCEQEQEFFCVCVCACVCVCVCVGRSLCNQLPLNLPRHSLPFVEHLHQFPGLQ